MIGDARSFLTQVVAVALVAMLATAVVGIYLAEESGVMIRSLAGWVVGTFR